MRFIVDECAGPTLAQWLIYHQHNVFSVYEEDRGLDDESVLKRAFTENRILITDDKDFGEMVFRQKKPHRGVILLRLENQRTENKIKVVKRLLEQYADQLVDNFVVVTETTVRIASIRRN